MTRGRKSHIKSEAGATSEQRPPEVLDLISRSPEETQAIGRVLGEMAAPGDLFLLEGELGTGKTCLTQGIAWGMGVKEYVRSPTFVLVSQYQGRIPLYHADLYRLEIVGALLDMGLEEYFHGSGCCVVEWAEKGAFAMPQDHLWVHLEYVSETERSLQLRAYGDRYLNLLAQLKPRLEPYGTSH